MIAQNRIVVTEGFQIWLLEPLPPDAVAAKPGLSVRPCHGLGAGCGRWLRQMQRHRVLSRWKHRLRVRTPSSSSDAGFNALSAIAPTLDLSEVSSATTRLNQPRCELDCDDHSENKMLTPASQLCVRRRPQDQRIQKPQGVRVCGHRHCRRHTNRCSRQRLRRMWRWSAGESHTADMKLGF